MIARSAGASCGLLLAMMASTARADPCEAIPSSGTLPPYLKTGRYFQGPVNRVLDGDSLCVALGPSPRDWVEVRLADFYAPELHDAGGADARKALLRLASGRQVLCRAEKRSYDRVVATCWLNGASLGGLLRGAGVGEGGRGLSPR